MSPLDLPSLIIVRLESLADLGVGIVVATEATREQFEAMRRDRDGAQDPMLRLWCAPLVGTQLGARVCTDRRYG